MIKVGITGSIASGKTTVAKIFSRKKYPLFDADQEVKKIYDKNFFKNKIYNKFDLKNKKNIKGKIKKLVSINKNNLQNLEKIIHPIVRKNLRNFIKRNKKEKFLIFEIPLLIESKLMKNFDKIIFVNSKKKIRMRRFLKKKGKNKKIFNVLNKRQLQPVKKIKLCDYVINNNSSLKKLKENAKVVQHKLCMR